MIDKPMIDKPLIQFEVPRNQQMKYKVLWHNCNNCGTHYTSEYPKQRANVCDKCWKSMPHYTAKRKVKVATRPAYAPAEWPIEYMLLYGLGCSLCMLIIAYYLWVK